MNRNSVGEDHVGAGRTVCCSVFCRNGQWPMWAQRRSGLDSRPARCASHQGDTSLTRLVDDCFFHGRHCQALNSMDEMVPEQSEAARSAGTGSVVLTGGKPTLTTRTDDHPAACVRRSTHMSVLTLVKATVKPDPVLEADTNTLEECSSTEAEGQLSARTIGWHPLSKRPGGTASVEGRFFETTKRGSSFVVGEP